MKSLYVFLSRWLEQHVIFLALLHLFLYKKLLSREIPLLKSLTNEVIFFPHSPTDKLKSFMDGKKFLFLNYLIKEFIFRRILQNVLSIYIYAYDSRLIGKRF